MQADHLTVKRFIEIIHAAAAHAVAGSCGDPGVLQLSVLSPRTDVGSMHSSRWGIGNVDGMTAAAISAAENGLNVYIEGRTIEAGAKGRGKAGATRGVFAVVDDADHDRGKGGTLSLTPSLIVETSPGNKHSWLFLDRALTAAEAEPLGRAMRAATGSDSATAKLTQPYRVAGTPNYPGPTKTARGRTVTPTRIVSADGPTWSAAALAAAFPPMQTPSTRQVPTGRSGVTSPRVADLVAESAIVDRSVHFFHAVVAAAAAGMLPGDLEEVMRRHPAGCASKYLTPTDRLADEINRAWSKVKKVATHPTVPPAYPDRGVPVDEARTAVRLAIEAHFAAGPGYRAIRIGTGIGKTTTAVMLIAEEIVRRRTTGDKRPFVYAVPRHALGDEIAGLFEDAGVTAQVFRGRNADDPDLIGTGAAMCRDLDAVRLAQTIGATISTACCKGGDPTGQTVLCAHYQDCSYQRQLVTKPAVWIVPHQLLFQPHGALGDPAAVVIDESFWAAGVTDISKGVSLDELAVVIADPARGATVASVEGARSMLVRALRLQDTLGGVERRHLVAAGLTVARCTDAIAAEWQLKTAAPMWPSMTLSARQAVASARGELKRLKSVVAIWMAARELLANEDADAISGRLLVDEAKTEHGRVHVVRTRGLRPIAKKWAKVSTLVLDATLPDIGLLRSFYPKMEIVADIEATMPHARVRQVVGAPTSANKLLRSEAGRHLSAVRRAILHRFAEVGRKPTLVVAQMKVAEWLRAAGLPDGIAIRHFNALSGLDCFGAVGLLIIVGRVLPTVVDVEGLSSAITGVESALTLAPITGGPRWYDKQPLGLRTKDGKGVAVEADRHPDPMAETVRWQICEAELMQAIGRARGVNRTAANPVVIDIWADVVLPISLDEVLTWDRLPSGPEAEMAASGIALDSPMDMAKCWPMAWGSAEAARSWQKRTASGQLSIEDTFYRKTPACGFRYRHPGEGQKWRTGACDPDIIPHPEAWLEARLGRLACFEIMSRRIDAWHVDGAGRGGAVAPIPCT